MNHICDLGDKDFKKHTAIMAKNTSYVSHFTVDEMVKVISDYTEAKFLNDLLAAGDFSLLTDESTNETGRAQLSIFVCYAMSTCSPTNQKKNLFASESLALRRLPKL